MTTLKDKHILYITNLWTGVEGLFYEGEGLSKGMPAFLEPLRQLLENGANVSVLFLQGKRIDESVDIVVPWLKDINVLKPVRVRRSVPGKLYSIYEYRRAVKKEIASHAYDFVYLHGSFAAAAGKILQNSDIPFGQRLYGTFLLGKIQKYGMWMCRLLFRNEYHAFVDKKEFLLVTNDGSKADIVVKKIFSSRKTPYDFYFWKNGVDVFSNLTKDEERRYELKYSSLLAKKARLLYVARVSPWKNQEQMVDILEILDQKNIAATVVFAGQITDSSYARRIIEKADKKGLKGSIEFLGGLCKKELKFLNDNCISFFLYEGFNLGNAFLESFSSGGAIVASDDGSLDEYIDNGETGFLVKNSQSAADAIEYLLNDPSVEAKIRSQSLSKAAQLNENWTSRVAKELALIQGND